MYRRLIEWPESLWVRVLGLWIRPAVLPAEPALLLDPAVPVCYVLEKGGIIDRAALTLMCRSHGLPGPLSGLDFAGQRESRAVIVLRRPPRRWFRKSHTVMPPRLERLVKVAAHAGHPELQLVPVGVYWGRSPGREDSIIKLMFSEHWGAAGRTRHFLKSIVHGRNTLVQFSKPMSFNTVTREEQADATTVRKVSRILRVHFRHRRIATLGPDLSHRRMLLDRVLRHPAVSQQIHKDAGSDPVAVSRTRQKALGYANEIAANLSYPTIGVLRKLLTRIWNRLYAGITLDGIERLNTIADGCELVYVPCHRSHIDYLLLSYILYQEGMSLPHIAAGKNLDIPVVGSLLRRGGAFFLRRTFRDNRLYAAVFNAYLQEIVHRGHALEYFIEGGRSRTGRLLKPKSGMLAMTAQAFLQDTRRPLVFVPIYFGYERLVEGGSFASELTGGKKQQESLLGLLRSFSIFWQKFGSVYVNIASPIEFSKLLHEQQPDWQSQIASVAHERPAWLEPVVDSLAELIQQRINAAASVTPVSLLSLALLTMPNGRIPENDLFDLVEFFRDLQQRLPYSDELVMTSIPVAAVVQQGIDLGYLERRKSTLGDIVAIREKRTIHLSFFRNNILHLYAIPALVAVCFHNQSVFAIHDIRRFVRLSYPYLQAELFLHWQVGEIDALVDATVAYYVTTGLLQWRDHNKTLSRAVAGSKSTFLLLSLGFIILPSLQRYFLSVSLLSRHGSGAVTARELGEQCRQCAERLEEIHGMQSPDFYDQALFRGFIDTLLRNNVVREDDGRKLCYDGDFARVDTDTRSILSELVRHSILNITARTALAAGMPDPPADS